MRNRLIRTAIIVCGACLLQGCVIPARALIGLPPSVSDSLDVSSGTSTAIIEGQLQGTKTCHMTHPAHAGRVTVDAGPVSLAAICAVFVRGSAFADRPPQRFYAGALFNFVAVAGRTYLVRPEISSEEKRRIGYIVLSDAATGEVIARNLADNQSMIRDNNQAITKNVATINCHRCYIDRRFGRVSIDAGRIRVEAQWYGIESHNRRSYIEFNASAGHAYEISQGSYPNRIFEGAPEIAQCALLVDITAEVRFISCEPIDFETDFWTPKPVNKNAAYSANNISQ
jgi:hypothetical protein